MWQAPLCSFYFYLNRMSLVKTSTDYEMTTKCSTEFWSCSQSFQENRACSHSAECASNTRQCDLYFSEQLVDFDVLLETQEVDEDGNFREKERE